MPPRSAAGRFAASMSLTLSLPMRSRCWYAGPMTTASLKRFFASSLR